MANGVQQPETKKAYSNILVIHLINYKQAVSWVAL